jgi:hypothetical protein
MTDNIASLFVDVHPSKATLTLCFVGNCFLIALMVKKYSLWQILLRELAEGRIRSVGKALNNRRSSRFDITFQGICAETNPSIS